MACWTVFCLFPVQSTSNRSKMGLGSIYLALIRNQPKSQFVTTLKCSRSGTSSILGLAQSCGVWFGSTVRVFHQKKKKERKEKGKVSIRAQRRWGLTICVTLVPLPTEFTIAVLAMNNDYSILSSRAVRKCHVFLLPHPTALTTSHR